MSARARLAVMTLVASAARATSAEPALTLSEGLAPAPAEAWPQPGGGLVARHEAALGWSTHAYLQLEVANRDRPDTTSAPPPLLAFRVGLRRELRGPLYVAGDVGVAQELDAHGVAVPGEAASVGVGAHLGCLGRACFDLEARITYWQQLGGAQEDHWQALLSLLALHWD